MATTSANVSLTMIASYGPVSDEQLSEIARLVEKVIGKVDVSTRRIPIEVKYD